MMMTMMMMTMKMPITEPTAAGMSKEADYMYTLATADTKFINNSIAMILHCSINDTLMQISAKSIINFYPQFHKNDILQDQCKRNSMAS